MIPMIRNQGRFEHLSNLTLSRYIQINKIFRKEAKMSKGEKKKGVISLREFLKNAGLLAAGIGMAIIISITITAGLPVSKNTVSNNADKVDEYDDRYVTGPLPGGSGDQDALLAMDPKVTTPWAPPFMLKQEPDTMSGKVTYSPHKHPYPELIGWFSTNKDNQQDLGCTITIYMGDEMEQHSFSKPTILWVPANIPHGVMVHGDMTRPIMYVNTFPKGQDGQVVDVKQLWNVPNFPDSLPTDKTTPSDGGKYGKYFISNGSSGMMSSQATLNPGDIKGEDTPFFHLYLGIHFIK
jgi:hypothetical protein